MLLRALAVVTVAIVFQDGRPAVRNGGFEEDPAAAAPSGWSLPSQSAAAGYSVKLTDDNPRSGIRSALLIRDLEVKQPGFGNLMQTLDAVPFRNRRVTLRAAVRTGPRARAQLWLRVDRAGGVTGFLDNMGDRPIVSPSWTEHRLEANVPPDATYLAFGLMLPGEGQAWLDDVSIESVALTVRPAAPPRPFTGRGLENVMAFTRLLGYVRYFHPSDEAAAADWDTFAIEGVHAVEDAGSAPELAKVLEERFRSIAPTVRVSVGRPAAAAAAWSHTPEARRIVMWKHRGLGSARGQIYRSERVTEDASGGRIAAGVANPVEPLIADLGGGVQAAVPLALWSDGEHTLPRVEPVGHAPISSSAADRATRLAAVALAWNVLQHFYPYFDVVPADWPASLRRALVSAAISDETAFTDTMRTLVAELHDGHGAVRSGTRTWDSHLPLAWEWIEGQLVVTETAGEGGVVKRGDVVRAIDGVPVTQRLAASERLISGATPQWKRYRALVELLSGPAGEVTLSVAGADAMARDVRLERRRGPPVEERRPDKIAEIRPGIFYVDPTRLSDQEFNAAVPQLVHAKGVIFEMRGYPQMTPIFLQRLIDAPVQSAQWLVPLVPRPDGRDWKWDSGNRWNLTPLAPRLGGRVAFITDGRAISYAESCMGIVEHYKLGEIVGAPTAGTNGNVNTFTVPGGYTITWTGMKVVKHDGARHHGVGILPTIPVSRTIKGVREGRDEMLERALEAVQRPGGPADRKDGIGASPR